MTVVKTFYLIKYPVIFHVKQFGLYFLIQKFYNTKCSYKKLCTDHESENHAKTAKMQTLIFPRDFFTTVYFLIAINLQLILLLFKSRWKLYLPQKHFIIIALALFSSQVQTYNLGCKVFHLILQLKTLPFIMASTKAIN